MSFKLKFIRFLRNQKMRRATRVVGGVLLIAVGISYTRALLAPNSPGWDLRTAEWLRDNHLGWALDAAEATWLTVHGPSAEELLPVRLSRFPEPFERSGENVSKKQMAEPVQAVAAEPLRGEGEWSPVGSTLSGSPTLQVTYFRPDPDCGDVTVAAARFTRKLSRFVLVPGMHDPGGDWSWHGVVPMDQRFKLLAAFNTGYRLRDAKGGIYVEGKEARPLVEGAASLVIDKNGDMNVAAWRGKLDLTPEVVAVRQNLKLLVDDGKLQVSVARKCVKGIDRSGLAITKDGTLIYVVGHRLTAALLAEAMQHLGAVRAMQLDAHMQWQSFNVFQPARASGSELLATKLTRDMRLPATRYLVPDDRDFVAAFVR